MAQNLKPNRSDNRGGNKPITSTKKLFIYRVERSMHEKLKAYAIELNKQVEEETETQFYTIVAHKYPFKTPDTKEDLKRRLLKSSAISEIGVLRRAAYLRGDTITKYYIQSLPCDTTEN